MSDDMAAGKGLRFSVEAISGVGHIPLKGEKLRGRFV